MSSYPFGKSSGFTLNLEHSSIPCQFWFMVKKPSSYDFDVTTMVIHRIVPNFHHDEFVIFSVSCPLILFFVYLYLFSVFLYFCPFLMELWCKKLERRIFIF